MSTFRGALGRILGSQKAAMAMVPVTANLIAAYTGYDATEPLLLVVDGFFGLLIAVQAVLDFQWGSPSDGTGRFSEPQLQGSGPQRVTAGELAQQLEAGAKASLAERPPR